jgi:hypothetical protein
MLGGWVGELLGGSLGSGGPCMCTRGVLVILPFSWTQTHLWCMASPRSRMLPPSHMLPAPLRRAGADGGPPQLGPASGKGDRDKDKASQHAAAPLAVDVRRSSSSGTGAPGAPAVLTPGGTVAGAKPRRAAPPPPPK